MKLLSRLFKTAPAPAQPSPPDDATPPWVGESPQAWVDAARASDDPQAMAAAISALPDGDTLRRLGGVTDGAPGADATPLLRAAQARLAALIDDGAIDGSEIERQSADRFAWLCVLSLCKDAGRLSRALAAIGEPGQIAQLAAHSPSSRVRQQAADLVDDPAQMRELLKQVRVKDKTVYKILKGKCDALNAAERQAAERAAEAEAICAALERHSHRAFDANYSSTFEHHHGRWLALAPRPDASLEPRVAQAAERCRQVIAEHQRHIAQQEAERAADLAARQAAADAREREAREAAEAAAAQAAVDAERMREETAAREAQAKAAAEARAAAEQSLRQLGGLVRKAQALVAEGNTQAAAGLRRAIEEKREAAPPLPAFLARSLQQLDDKLDELKQWKDFAVAPKRAELIAEMESLVGCSDEPTVLAERIKALQQDWKTVSKGIVIDPPEDWERFHRAAQAAYLPCKSYFEAQARIRHDNLELRQALLQRVAAFEAAQDWEHPDWSLLARVLREAPLEWRRHFPVEREAGRAVQAEFEAAMPRLQARLEAWHAGNAAAKQALIQRARHLLAHDDGREAVEGIKHLQAQWKDAGPSAREQEQSLWREFREACDAIFQKRQQAHAQHSAELEAAKAQAIMLCDEVEAAVELAGADRAAAVKKIPEWRAAFTALGELPRADARGLRDRFEQALARCEAEVTRQRERDAEQSFTHLFDAGRQVAAFGCAVAQGAGVDGHESLKQAAEACIAGVARWPKGGLQAVKETLLKAAAATRADVEAGERALRMLCIRAEIHAEMPTPAEDEALRREYQVQRLMRSMGQGTSAQERDWEAMALEWIRSGPASPAVYDALLERFLHCRPRATPRAAQRR